MCQQKGEDTKVKKEGCQSIVGLLLAEERKVGRTGYIMICYWVGNGRGVAMGRSIEYTEKVGQLRYGDRGKEG